MWLSRGFSNIFRLLSDLKCSLRLALFEGFLLTDVLYSFKILNGALNGLKMKLIDVISEIIAIDKLSECRYYFFLNSLVLLDKTRKTKKCNSYLHN